MSVVRLAEYVYVLQSNLRRVSAVNLEISGASVFRIDRLFN